MKRLTLKQMRYCQWFILLFADGSQAAKHAGYKGYYRQQSYRLYRTNSVRIFLKWTTQICLDKHYIPWLDNQILQKRLRLYGYKVNPKLVTYAEQTAPSISYKTLNQELKQL